MSSINKSTTTSSTTKTIYDDNTIASATTVEDSKKLNISQEDNFKCYKDLFFLHVVHLFVKFLKNCLCEEEIVKIYDKIGKLEDEISYELKISVKILCVC